MKASEKAVIRDREIYVTSAEAARKLGVSRQRIHQWVKAGMVESIAVGHRRLLPKHGLKRPMERRGGRKPVKVPARYADRYCSVETLARMMGCSLQYVYAEIHRGNIKAIRPKGLILVPIHESKRH